MLGKILKFAKIYRIATLFAFGSAQDAVRTLVDLIDTNDLIPIGTNYQAINTPSVSDAEKIEALHSLKELIDELNAKYSSSEDAIDISDALSEIYSEAASAVSHLNLDEEYENDFTDQVDTVSNNLGIQEGESDAKGGGFSITQDMNEKLQRQKEQKKEKRQNPLTRAEVLEYNRQQLADIRQQDPERIKNTKTRHQLKADILAKLMSQGLSKEDAEARFEELRLSILQQKLQALKEKGEVSAEEAKDKIKHLSSEALQRMKDFSKFHRIQTSYEQANSPAVKRVYKQRSIEAARKLYVKEAVRDGMDESLAQSQAAQFSPEEIESLKQKYMQEAQKLVA